MRTTYKYAFIIFASGIIGLVVYKSCKSDTSQLIPMTYDKAYVEPLYGFSEAAKERFKNKEVVFRKVGEMKNPSIDFYNCFGGGWETDPGDFRRIKVKSRKGRVFEYDNDLGWVKVLEKGEYFDKSIADSLKTSANSTKVKMHPYGVTLDMGKGDQILILFGFPYNTDPAGLLTLIYVGKHTAEMIFNKHVDLLEIAETANGYRLKGKTGHNQVSGWGETKSITYPGPQCEILIKNNNLSFHQFPRFDRSKLALPFQVNRAYIDELKSYKYFWDHDKKGSIDWKLLGQVPALGVTITQCYGKDWDAQLGDFTRVGFELNSDLRIDFSNFVHGWSKPSDQIKLPEKSTKVIKHEYGIILDIGGGNHILALTGYKYTQEPSFLTLICVTPDNADMVFNKKLELLEVQETEKGYRLLGQLPATQEEQTGRLCEVCIEEGELKFKEL